MKKITLFIAVLLSIATFGQTTVDLPITFDSTNVNYDLASFGGNSDSIVSDPAGGTNKVLRAIKSNTAQTWAGTTVGSNGFANAIPFAANANTIQVRVYSPDANIPVRLKVEDSSDPTKSVEVEVNTSVANAWDTLNFDFTNHVSGTSAINYANTYDMASLFFNFGTDGATAGTKTYYADDIVFLGAGGGSMQQMVSLPITFDSTNVNYDLVSFGGNSDTIVTDPAGGTNMVMQATKSNTAQTWSGTTMGGSGLAQAIPFSASNNMIKVRVYSPDTNVPVRLKVEDAADPTKSVETEVNTTVANAWDTLTFDFSNNVAGTPIINYANTYNKISIFFNFGTAGSTAGTKIYYADDVMFMSAGGGPQMSQVDLPITFDSTNVNYDLVSFGGNSDTIVTDPAGGMNMVMQATKSNTAQLWAGTTMGNGGLAQAIPFSSNNNTIQVRVYSPDANIPVRLKVEDATDPTKSVETEVNTTVANAWDTLTFDFTNNVTGTPAINYANTYDKISIFFNFGTDGATAGTKTYYADDVMFVTAGGGGGPQLNQVDLPITFDSTNVNYDLISFGGNTDTIVTDPAGGTNLVMQATKGGSAQTWAGTTMGGSGLASAIPFTANANTMSVRVYSPDSGIPVRLKVEDASDPTISVETEVNTTVANAWDTLVFDFTNQAPGTSAINYANTYNKVSIFFNFGTDGATAGTKVYYADDVVFGGSTGGGGGGGPQLKQVDMPINFDSTSVDYALVSFGGNTDSIAPDPAGAMNRALRVVKTAGAQTWAGTTLGGNGLVNAIPFAANANIMEVRVYSPAAGTPILLKVEDATDGSISVETFDTTTVANAWETLTFDFTKNASGTPAIDYNQTYDKVSIFFNFGISPGADEVYYADDVVFNPGVSIEENTGQTFSLSPNPSNGLVRLQGALISEQATTISVYSIDGRLITKQHHNQGQRSAELDLSDVRSGIYFVVVEGTQDRHTVKLVLRP